MVRRAQEWFWGSAGCVLHGSGKSGSVCRDQETSQLDMFIVGNTVCIQILSLTCILHKERCYGSIATVGDRRALLAHSLT